MARAKNQHYVPQFYLRHFTKDGTQIHVYDKHTSRSFVANVRNVASENHFYDFSDEQLASLLERIRKRAAVERLEDRLEEIEANARGLQRIEEDLAELERGFAEMYESLLYGIEENARWLDGPPRITSLKMQPGSERTAVVDRLINAGRATGFSEPELALFVTLQYLRTNDQRKWLVEFYEKTTTALYKMVARTSGAEESRLDIHAEVDPNRLQEIHFRQMLNPELIFGIAEVLQSHILYFVVNNTGRPLLTSDTPVALIPHFQGPMNTGFASPGIEVYMPLTPRFGVVYLERSHNHEMRNMVGKTIPLEPDNVLYYNSVMINQADRQIYSPADDFDLVRRTIVEHPEVFDPDRPRVIVQGGVGQEEDS